MEFFDGDLIHEAVLPAYKGSNTVEPDANIYNLGHEFIIKLEMPGVAGKIDIAINEGELVIAGKKEINCDSIKPMLSECENKLFMREITIPEGVTVDDLTTEYVDGIFIIHVPKIVKLKESAMKAYDKKLADNSLKISDG